VIKDFPVHFLRQAHSLRELCGKQSSEQLIAGVSSFGYAGTIAHAVLSQALTGHGRPPITLAAVPSESGMTTCTAGMPGVQWALDVVLPNRQAFPWFDTVAHPFLGIREKCGDATVWTCHWDSKAVEYLSEHRVGNVSLVPGTC